MGEDGFIKQIVSINEEGLRKCAEATDIYNKPVTDWTLLVDLDELNMRHLWRPGIRALLRIIETVEVNYPETKGEFYRYLKFITNHKRCFGKIIDHSVE